MSESSNDSFSTVEGLEAAGVKYVRLTWTDFINFTRYRVIPIKHFKQLVTSAPVTLTDDDGGALEKRKGIMLGKVCFGIAYLAVAEGFSPTGSYIYVPDMSSARLLSHAPGHASVLGWFEEVRPILNRRGEKTLQADFCPRTTLRNIVV